ncbi:hypothetical protein Sru01_16250 [Sphaerisporangium rufum]|uniref:DUF433 domain-containing protein n=1 Tax=Sphaerisporangium rufum TaxID=1381558 RepID=A0A919R0B9_9ACTN|nr:DUF433 domain-containing protein [Sphaerisporangium rufum]GII76643.1 hypothetical protein Sru01_16250 [Sphaerisporangium rufum]
MFAMMGGPVGSEEVKPVSYTPKLAAALSGATLRQLAHWRTTGVSRGAVLVPEISPVRPVLYSFRDVVALRTCVKLRNDASLQKIRRALDTLRGDLQERDHLSAYRLVADGSTIYLLERGQVTDLVHRKANIVIHELVDVLRPFYRDGRHIPDLLRPRQHVTVDPSIRGGMPVIDGTRVPYDEIAELLRDGVPAERIAEYYPSVSATAALDAADFADYVDSCDLQGNSSATALALSIRP